MTFIESITTCFNKYATFKGRATRSEYWWFVLFCFLVHIAASLIGNVVAGLAGLVLFLPSLAVLARRLHDIDRTAWWILIGFIPVIGALVLLIFAVTQGTADQNRFGGPAA